MKQEDLKYFSFTDIVNTALTNPEEVKGKKNILDNKESILCKNNV